MKAKNSKTSFEKISPTAWLVACQRTLSDISYSKEVFDELNAIMRQTRSVAEIQELKQLIHPEITPVIEARVKLVNRLLKENNSKQILEIAAGFSTRGIEMAQNSSVKYVEVDLPTVIDEKRSIVEKLIEKSKITRQTNLHLCEGNVLNLEDLLLATKPFKEGSIAVVNEGLLTYLNFDEKTEVAKNIHELLERFGGVWITPDLSLQPEGKAKETNIPLRSITGINKDNFAFKDEASARTFFENLGFTVESHSFVEILDELASPVKLNFSKEQVIKILGPRVVFVMRLKN